jgi:hypothetical protein
MAQLKEASQRRTGVVRLLGALLFVMALGAPWHTTAEPAASQPGAGEPAVAQASPLQPALIVVPESDGQGVLVQAGGVGQLGGQVFTNLRIGPSGNKGSYTMAYSDTVSSYVVNIPGFPAGASASAGLSITTTQGLDSGELTFTRGFFPAGQRASLTTDDGGLELQIINAGTFPGDTYIAATPSFAPPAAPPAGYRLAGRSYSLRASGALPAAALPMILRLSYEPAALTAEEQAALRIFAWDPAAGRWDNLGGSISTAPPYVSVAAERFTFYALMTVAPEPQGKRLHLPLLHR